MAKNLLSLAMVTVLVAAALAPAWSQDDKRASREREILRRAQQQVQQANQELANAREKFDAAEAQRAELATEVERAQSQERAQFAGRQRLQREVTGLSAERDRLKMQTEEQAIQIQTLTSRVSALEQELASAAQRSEQVRKAQIQAQARQTQLADRIEACELRNEKLYATGRELVDQCRDRSASDRVLRLEPFSGMGRVELENRLEVVRDQLDASKTPVTP